jgi:hypothetical protein
VNSGQDSWACKHCGALTTQNKKGHWRKYCVGCRPLATIADDDGLVVAVRASHACTYAGITYRQLDYWTRQGYIVPHIAAKGSGSQRHYSIAQVVTIAIVAAMVRQGMKPSSAFTFARGMVQEVAA